MSFSHSVPLPLSISCSPHRFSLVTWSIYLSIFCLYAHTHTLKSVKSVKSVHSIHIHMFVCLVCIHECVQFADLFLMRLFVSVHFSLEAIRVEKNYMKSIWIGPKQKTIAIEFHKYIGFSLSFSLPLCLSTLRGSQSYFLYYRYWHFIWGEKSDHRIVVAMNLAAQTVSATIFPRFERFFSYGLIMDYSGINNYNSLTIYRTCTILWHHYIKNRQKRVCFVGVSFPIFVS